jgi:Cytochrome c554 and c-prime
MLSGLPLCCALGTQSNRQSATNWSQFRPRRSIAGVEFAGREVCAQCHTQQAHTQAKTAMAQAMQVAAESGVLRTHPRLTFQAGAYSYEIRSVDGQAIYRVSDGKDTFSEALLYAFGGAHIAQTFVFRRNDKFYESRVSYYTLIDGLDWTLGDALVAPSSAEEAASRDITGDQTRDCFSCHTSRAIAKNKLGLDRAIPGVDCEACHGPGAQHVAAMKSGDLQNRYIFNPATLDAATLSQDFCGACHRGADVVSQMPNFGGLTNIRFQPYRLFTSRGHSGDDRRFACTACHDPHVNLVRDDASYDSHCQACHDPRNVSHARKLCPIAKSACVSCHMPKVELPSAHYKFTDHRVRIVRPGEPYPS